MQGFDRTSSCIQIIADLHLDPVNNAALMNQMGSLWDSYIDKKAIAPRLQDLYTRRQACDNLLGGTWPLVDYTQAGAERKLTDITANLQQMRGNYHAEIQRLEARAQASRPGAVGRMNTDRYRPCPNPNNPAYGGDPLLRTYGPRDF
jgi:hypothetical protein